MRYEFEWNPRKAESNLTKHGVTFEHATDVFRDPRAISLFDDEHSETEDRWITLGLSSLGVLVDHHTDDYVDDDHVRIRIISSRKPATSEVRQYAE